MSLTLATPAHPLLLRVVIRLGHGVRAIQEENYNLLEYFLPDVHGTVHAIARLDPIRFAHGDRPGLRVAAIAKLDIQQIPPQNHGQPMKGIAVPRRRLPRRQLLSPDQIISAMMQDLLICRQFHN